MLKGFSSVSRTDIDFSLPLAFYMLQFIYGINKISSRYFRLVFLKTLVQLWTNIPHEWEATNIEEGMGTKFCISFWQIIYKRRNNSNLIF